MNITTLPDTLLNQFGLLSLSSITQSFALTFISLPFLIRVAKARKLLDKPNERKIHQAPTPSLGGIGIFVGLLLTGIFWTFLDFNWQEEIVILFGCMFVLFLLGLKDDLQDVRASKKLLLQVLAALITAWGGLRFVSLYGFLGVEEMPLWLQYSLSAFIITGIINAYNLLDGLDGLAGGIALINCLIFGALFTLGDLGGYAALSFAIAGSLGAFLYFNFNPARIFMGDSGSLVIGYLMAALAFKAVSAANAADSFLNQKNLMIIVFAVLLLPVADTIRVFTFRIVQGHSPFRPDNNHIHHLFLKAGLTVKQTTLLIYGVNCLFIGLAVACRALAINWAIGILLLTASFVFLLALVASRLRLFRPSNSTVRENKSSIQEPLLQSKLKD